METDDEANAAAVSSHASTTSNAGGESGASTTPAPALGAAPKPPRKQKLGPWERANGNPFTQKRLARGMGTLMRLDSKERKAPPAAAAIAAATLDSPNSDNMYAIRLSNVKEHFDNMVLSHDLIRFKSKPFNNNAYRRLPRVKVAVSPSKLAEIKELACTDPAAC